MDSHSKKYIVWRIVAAFLVVSLFGNFQGNASAFAQGVGKDVLYTTDADFDLGTLVSVNHHPPNNNQLQLDSPTEPFPFINVAASGRGTVVRANTETGEIVGEYRTAPEGRGLNPSRTTVDLFGNVWTANRDEVGSIDGVPHGSAVKIGLIVGGTRVDESGTPNPDGGYLAPPFRYNTCSDRNGDGLIRTSKGLGDILDWPDLTDGMGGPDGLVEDAVDECILIYQRLPNAEQARHVSVDADNNVWVGGYPFVLRMFYKLEGATGTFLDSFNAANIGCGGYGGLVDGNGILWSVGGALLRYDPATHTGFCIDQYGYGLGIDTNGYIWMSLWDGGIVKVAPDGTVVPGFPKATYPPSMITMAPVEAANLVSPAPLKVDTAVKTVAPHAVVDDPREARVLPKGEPAPEWAAPAHPSARTLPVRRASGQGRKSMLESDVEPLGEDPIPTFMVAPNDNWVSSYSPWAADTAITLTIEEGGEVVYSGSQMSDSSGNFFFRLWEQQFNLRRGQVVTVSDGVATKTHTVMPLYVDAVDEAGDAILGRGEPGVPLRIWVHGDGDLTVTPDASGNWTADFSGQTDLTNNTDGGSEQVDADGDATDVWWGATPRLQAAPEDEWVQAAGFWPSGVTVTLTIEDGGTPVYSDTQVTDDSGYFFFNLWDVFDLQRGQVVTVSDGNDTKTHTVIPLYVDHVDVGTDTISGRGQPNTSVDVWVHGNGGLTVTSDAAGNWAADFSGQTDLTYNNDGGSQQFDDDGDSTGVWWAVIPRFQVVPEEDRVDASNRWASNAPISLTIEEGGEVVYSTTTTAGSHGYFQFNLSGMFNVKRGQLVTVSDGTTTKQHLVTQLDVEAVNVDTEIVSGRADPSSDVEIWVHGNGGLTVTSDASGNWTADFSGQTDLTPLSDGGSQQYDSDGDATGVWWASPRIQAAPAQDWVQPVRPWSPGETLTLTIEDGGVLVYTDTLTADNEGYFYFDLWDVFDLQRGQVVTVSGTSATKVLTVMPLYVDYINVDADTISGRGQPNTGVDVWVHGDGNLFVTADASGNWTADFSGQTDLTYANDGGSQQFDDDGDSTGVWWSSPAIRVSPENDRISARGGWTPGATISLTIEDGGVVVYSDTQVADSLGVFSFDLWDILDLQYGQVVTVTDGIYTKTHTIANLFVDSVDVAADTVSGRADPGAKLDGFANGTDVLYFTADASGHWVADFSGHADLTYLSEGVVRSFDEDGDFTRVWWASPRIQVAPNDNWVQSSSRWTPGTTVTLTIRDGGVVVYTDSQMTDMYGNFNFNLWDVFDLQRGQEVTVTDGINTKTHTVLPLFVDAIDVAADTISGRGQPNTEVEVWVHGDGNLFVTADASGNWTADFSGQTDLTYANDGGSQQVDDDGDSTGVWWASPRIEVAPDDNWVGSWGGWPAGSSIALTIEDGGVVVYSALQIADDNGNFSFNLGGTFDLERGQVVTVTNGTTTKTHTIMPLYVDAIDVAADTITGRGQPDTEVQVWVHGDGDQRVITDTSGNWTVDFSGQTDLTFVNDGGSRQIDDDGDTTGVWWSSPSIQVSPDDNWVSSWNRWKPGVTITLTVEDGGVVVYTDSQTTDTNGNFNFNVWGIDLITGHHVTISGDGITKSHTITDVSISDIDSTADLVRGTAIPGARLWIWAYQFSSGSGRTVYADQDGNWVADFSVGSEGQPAYDLTDITFINANEFDDDGDSTYRRAGPAVLGSTGVAVTPTDNNVWIANRNPGTVTRLDNDGNFLAAIETGNTPTGVAVDADGKVWATNLGSDDAARIDPNAGPDGLGAVDLKVDLGQGAGPYNYSDMTGAVVVGSTSPQGFWMVVQDSETPGFEWGRILWNQEPEGSEPAGSAIIVEARAADTQAGLGGQIFQPVVNGELFSMFGSFIEVRVTLKASPDGVSPVLSDIRIQPHVIYVGIDIKPGSFPNAINCMNQKEVISVAVLTTETFDALSVNYTTVTFEGAKEIHVDKRTGLPVRHTEDIDLDGDMDLVFHFSLRQTSLTCASTSGTLVGLTYEGIPIQGTDSIWMVQR